MLEYSQKNTTYGELAELTLIILPTKEFQGLPEELQYCTGVKKLKIVGVEGKTTEIKGVTSLIIQQQLAFSIDE